MIAYYFPPAGSVGVYRTLKFARYLREFGWAPTVLTVDKGAFEKQDDSLMSWIPDDVRVERTASWEPFRDGTTLSARHKDSRRLVDRIRNRLGMMWSWLMVPDVRVTWNRTARTRALELIREHDIKHVYVSGKPFSSFLIGLWLKRKADIKLIVDYRDPWTQNLNYHRRSPLHTWWERALERRVVAAADLVVSNTRFNDERMAAEFGGDEVRDKFVAIHNGFDANDFAGPRPERFARFTITYAGVFYFSIGSDFAKSAGDAVMRTYSPLYFFEALERLFAHRPDIKANFQVKFMGGLGYGYDPYIVRHGLKDVIDVLGYLSYNEHVDVLRRSHALLLVLSSGPQSRGWIPSKFFQYLGSGNPVLGLVPEGEVRDIIEQARAGTCVEPDDVQAAADAIGAMYDEYFTNNRYINRDETVVRQFERRTQAEKLATSLDRL